MTSVGHAPQNQLAATLQDWIGRLVRSRMQDILGFPAGTKALASNTLYAMSRTQASSRHQNGKQLRGTAGGCTQRWRAWVWR